MQYALSADPVVESQPVWTACVLNVPQALFPQVTASVVIRVQLVPTLLWHLLNVKCAPLALRTWISRLKHPVHYAQLEHSVKLG